MPPIAACGETGRMIRRLAILLLVISTAAAGAEPEQLVVASDFDNPPFASWKSGDQPEGLEPALARDLARKLGRPVRWKRVPFETLLTVVSNGEADLAIATMGITPERSRIVDFSRPYYRTEIAVVVRAGDNDPTSLSDLAARPVGAARGTTSDRAVRLRLPDAVLVLDRKEEESFRDLLLDGRIDAVCMDRPNAERLVRESPASFRRLEEALAEERYAIAVARGNAALLESINEFLLQRETAHDPSAGSSGK